MDATLTWLNTPMFHAFGAPATRAEILGFATGAVCVYLVAVRNALNWPIGIANAVFFIVLFAGAGLYADSALQIVYIALGLYGWYQWLRGGENRSELPVSQFTGREWAAVTGAGLAATATTAWVLGTWTSSTVPLADAVTTALSLVATYGQARKKIGSWYLWIAADLVYVPLYLYKGLALTAVLYTGFLALCVYGLIDWRRAYLDQRPAADNDDRPAVGAGAVGA